jgi:sugar/nucleoside kinase (ribokinase family)
METDQKPALLCVGNAMVDLFVNLSGKIPDAWGLPDPVQHVCGGHMLRILGEIAPPAASSGGGAANVAKIAALLGVSSAFVGALGEDPYAAVFEGELSAAGVIPLLTRNSSPTGLCLVIKQGRGSSPVIAACPQAALGLCARNIPEAPIRDAKAVILDGFLLGRDTLVHRILDLANQYGTPVAMDVGSAALAESRAGEIARYCRDYPLILFMNEAEAAAFCRAQGEEDDLEVFLRRMTSPGDFPIIVVKRGKRGATVFAGDHRYSAPAIAVSSAETTGAGDAFCAGFMAAWIRGRSLLDCAALGNKTAREVLDSPGTRVDRKKLAPLAKLLAAGG